GLRRAAVCAATNVLVSALALQARCRNNVQVGTLVTMRTSIATVCLSGSLTEKLHACAAAGFDGVEIMDADLVAAYESPEEIRALCERLGLTIDLFQPFRDFEGVDDVTFADNMRRAEAK